MCRPTIQSVLIMLEGERVGGVFGLDRLKEERERERDWLLVFGINGNKKMF